MRFFLLSLMIVLPFCSTAQISTTETQTIDGYHFILEKGTLFKSVATNETDTFRVRIDSIVFSTGNPMEEMHMQFLNKNLGFIYGSEMGYGYWPFLFKTTDGGKNWVRKLFKKRHSGVPIAKDNFFMFDNKRGILIQNTDNVKQLLNGQTKVSLTYYLTNDGGETWLRKKFPLKTRNIRLENSHYFLECAYTQNGKITIHVLRPPWASPEGKREAKDRRTIELTSYDFGKNFTEKLLK